MRICPILLLVWLTLLSRVSAEWPRRVIATIPTDDLLRNATKDEGGEPLVDEGDGSRAMTDLEVTGFITKSGDIFELPLGRSMGSIEAREEPELEPGMTMCRYGTIVVYSDLDCNSFFRPSELPGRPLKSKIQNGNESEADADSGKPVKKRNKLKGTKRKTNKNKKRNNKNRQKQQQRRKALKKKQNQKRRRNKLKNGGNPQKKNRKRVNKTRRGNNSNKRRRINRGEERSDVTAEPLQFTVLLNRH